MLRMKLFMWVSIYVCKYICTVHYMYLSSYIYVKLFAYLCIFFVCIYTYLHIHGMHVLYMCNYVNTFIYFLIRTNQCLGSRSDLDSLFRPKHAVVPFRGHIQYSVSAWQLWRAKNWRPRGVACISALHGRILVIFSILKIPLPYSISFM